MPNPRVFFEISMGGDVSGRVEFELFADVVPKTAENFRALCVGDRKNKTGKRNLRFLGSAFHRVIRGFMAQGGDFTRGDGTGGESIYGEKFADENFKIKHTQAGLLSMANSGRDSNGSQFFITFKETPHLDYKHVVFGKVVEGMDFIKRMEMQPTGRDDIPKRTIEITDCGEIKTELSTQDSSERASAFSPKSNSNINKNKSKKQQQMSKSNDEEEKAAVSESAPAVEEKEKEVVVDVEVATKDMNPMEKRLFMLKLKMNQGRKANKAAVENEFRKVKDSNYEDRQIRHEKVVEKKEAKKTGEDKAFNANWGSRKGQKEDPLNMTIEQAAHAATTKEKKNTAARTHGLEGTLEDKRFRSYEKRLGKLPTRSGESSSSSSSVIGLGAGGNASSSSSSGSSSKAMVKGTSTSLVDNQVHYGSSSSSTVSKAGLDRLGKHIQEAEESAADRDFKRMKKEVRGNDEGNLLHINSKNETLNKQIAKSFDKYTVEVRQNLERGSAI